MFLGLRLSSRHVFNSQHIARISAVRHTSQAASTSAAVQSSIRESFSDIRNSLSLVDQGERVKAAEDKAKELSDVLAVS